MGLPSFSTCYGLLSSVLVLLPVVTGIPIPQVSELVRRYDDSSNYFSLDSTTPDDNLNLALNQGSSDLNMFGDFTNGQGDGTMNLDGLDDNLNLDGGVLPSDGLGDDALNVDDGSFQIAENNNCKIWFPWSRCGGGTGAQDKAPAPAPSPEVQPETVPTPYPTEFPNRQPEFDCQIRFRSGDCQSGDTVNQAVSVPPSDGSSAPTTPLDDAGNAVIGAGVALFGGAAALGANIGNGLAPLINLGNQ